MADGFDHSAKALLRAIACGPKRARTLTLEESRALLLGWSAQEVTDLSLGAALMVMRSRGETPAEVAGVALALRQLIASAAGEEASASPGAGASSTPFIDWPCYAGKRGQFPWLLYGVKRLQAEGIPVLLHGDDGRDAARPGGYSRRSHVGQALHHVGIPTATSVAEARAFIGDGVSCYLPLSAILPRWRELGSLHATLGIRSLLTQALKFINPLNAPLGMRAFFHPKLEQHYAEVIALMAREQGHGARQLLFRGFQGEAEPNPRVETELWQIDADAYAEGHANGACPRVPSWLLPACAPEGTQASLNALADDAMAHRQLGASALPGAGDDTWQGACVRASLAAAYLLTERADCADAALALAYSGKAQGSGPVGRLCALMMAEGVTEAEALGLLRRHSMHTGQSMAVLADSLLRQRGAVAQ
ncbi:ANTAR domain-containing protein [Shewanella cyperi]|uniref:ANTAR domain-containing protein n=1 Tax=Shewanella cyperi TaxID=2814292 RepID=UPI001A94ED5D|nr:ANTAR domain-containing protein [Shewanella cyperi]QSX42157.1 ANTAR domain-containing protein [Shewanella cyperi]